MRGQGGFFDVEEWLKELSAKGDDLERLNAIVDFELFRADLARAVPRSDGSRGGRRRSWFNWTIPDQSRRRGRLSGQKLPLSASSGGTRNEMILGPFCTPKR